ncbi:type II toxin-antitoxin system RelE/ParE family toxin [Ruficoccus amylovorans]|uniref:Type II toxin-antitoxin system RelE/ParE family toxin n=1 Tax=Ruficoccus amylovorans TaxID=1804625 RepID=A0A842H9T9_9BACT|nr:type II toxin-antitoxin system RelE/ParE family toxin [Ruficoccus amylovorans]
MARTVEFHPLFSEDVEAQARYLQEEAELGEAFLEKVEEAVAAVKAEPMHHGFLYGSTRHIILRKFRRHIVHYEYFEKEDLIRFYGLFHGSENPARWWSRL